MEARKIRIGNDIRITWTLKDEEGNPYIIEAESYEIWLACYGYRQKTAAVVTGNVAEFTFYGKDQRTAGSYALLLIENRGGIPMVTYDVKDVFRLVDHSWETGTGGEPAEGIAVDEAVDIESTLVDGETKKVRIGNDLTIKWTLNDGDTPYNLEGRNFEVWMACYGYRQKVTALTVSGNEITFTFFGKDQRVAGSYALLYCENKGQPAMLTYDTKDAFELVEHSWDTDEDDESDVVTDTVELVSQITANGISAEQIIEALGYVPANVEDIPTELSELAGDATHRTVTDEEKAAWNAKYDKPPGGIPASDLAPGVIPDVPQEIHINYNASAEAVLAIMNREPNNAVYLDNDGRFYPIVIEEKGNRDYYVAFAGWDGNTLFRQFEVYIANLDNPSATISWDQYSTTLPSVPTISTNIANDASSNTKTASPKAVADYATHFLTAGGKKIWTGTQAQYDVLTPSDDTIYFIKED